MKSQNNRFPMLIHEVPLHDVKAARSVTMFIGPILS